MRLTIEFGGGLEGLVKDNQKRLELHFKDKDEITCQDLITHITKTLIIGRKDFFALENGAIKPGILVLVNDCDWELVGGPNTKLKSNDLIGFISTLHGG